MNIKNIDDKIHGGLFGLLIGDAVGVPYEFKSKNEIKNIAMFAHDLINKTYPNIPYGTWSDDGSQSLILLESLITQGRLDLNDFLQNLAKWLFNGYMAVDQKVFDVGIQSYEYISTFKKQGFFEVDPQPQENQNGNGSLMRCLPLVLWHRGSNQALVQLAHEQSMVTHPHMRSQVCCAWYCLIAKQLFIYHDFNKAMSISTQILIDIYLKTSNTIALDD